MTNIFNELVKVDVTNFVEKKNGLSYLSWAYGWKFVKEKYPSATYRVLKSKAMVNGCENELNYFTDGKTAWVETEVTIEDISEVMYLPVMDYRNKSIPLENITSFDVNKNIMRCLAKNIAVNFGLGITLYTGEDLPSEEEKPKKVEKCGDYFGAEHLADLYTEEEQKIIMKKYNVRALKNLPKEVAIALMEKREGKSEELSLVDEGKKFY